jgi:glycosyltransferase involved in cell wall biosynthesis
MLFSLIIATIGRKEELRKLLESLLVQDIDPDLFEIIVIDQNQTDLIWSMMNEYKEKFKHFEYYRSDVKGLSYNRNIGISIANGEILAFPDDDCTYYPDTLSSVSNAFNIWPNASFILGSICNRDDNTNIIRNWPKVDKKVHMANFFFLYSSITIFTKNKLYFSEILGVGARFGSYEDADYIAMHLKLFGPGMYTPSINVWHPEVNINVMTPQKVYGYGEGFGALCHKHNSPLFVILFISSILFHSLRLVSAFLRHDRIEISKRSAAIRSRLDGWQQYKSYCHVTK